MNNTTSGELRALRQQIDDIDHQMIDLLKQRMSIVNQVGAFKEKTSTGMSFIRSGREAMMLRELTSKIEGDFPAAAIATIWRMIISTSLHHEQNIRVLTYVGETKDCYWLAREYYGSFLSIDTSSSADDLIQQVAKNPELVGVLPLFDDSKHPWWVRPQDEKNKLHVFARIPFIEYANSSEKPVLAIANLDPEETGNDVSLIAIQTELDQVEVEEQLMQQQLSYSLLDLNQGHFLYEIEGFLAADSSILSEISASLTTESMVRLLGSYAVPIKVA